MSEIKEIPKGTVGLVDESDRAKKDEVDAVSHAQKSAGKGNRHLLTEQEEYELEEKERKRREVQERARQRIAEAEAKNPKLKEKNPHIL